MGKKLWKFDEQHIKNCKSVKALFPIFTFTDDKSFQNPGNLIDSH